MTFPFDVVERLCYSVLKVVHQVGLVFSNSNFFINKSSQGRKSVHEKSTHYCKFGFAWGSWSSYSKLQLWPMESKHGYQKHIHVWLLSFLSLTGHSSYFVTSGKYPEVLAIFAISLPHGCMLKSWGSEALP